MEWRPMEAYPPCKCGRPDCDWGPEVVVMVAGSHEPVRYVARLEAGMWLARDPYAEGGICWGGLLGAPIYWYPIPEVVRDIHTAPQDFLSQGRAKQR